MGSVAKAAVFTIIGIAVVWLLAKMSRSDDADTRLVVLGVAAVAALIAIGAGLLRRSGRREPS